MAISSSLDAESRRSRLLEILGAEGRITISDAAETLGVSEMTLRRDLGDLESLGQVRRVRGGAVAPLQPQSFSERSSKQAAAKRLIAQKAQRLVPREGVCAFDASSTIGVLLSGLSDAADLTVVTNSAENFRAAEDRPGVTPVLVGGHRERRTDSFVGPHASLTAASLHYSAFMTSAAALDAEWGSSEATAGEAALKRVFHEHADITVLLVDSSKLNSRAVARALGLEEVDVLVTELDPSHPRLDAYRPVVELL
ncbi:DeoR/GlpR family DNA-binding transcription regulator [Nesterenkonia flava]|uniref:DeoR/GlpR family DNA-binding transcription regulator n=1 Tax=Nesterenkonia flava TaxID=469799 RepID=A0ABU1FS73_9MICC|nr:DeoR/GlpR family DNA-binding transcription regulator [Nesterenkonia flava]MDR5711523.1 DeoR/GlpR family DNA-binding transcription regulator [Nesterenkonia flava]